MPRKIIRLWLFLLVFGLWLVPKQALTATTDFPAFFQTFQTAVAANDKNTLADMSDFSDFTWEASGGPVPSRDAFLQRFDHLFTPAIKKNVAVAKPVAVGDGNFFASWRVKNEEYSLFFIPKVGGFTFLGLTVGPR